MSTPGHALNEVFEIRSRFKRSVDLERDILTKTALDGYIPTPLARATLGRIFDGLRREATARAWTLTGPYGAGKSAFALFLASLLGNVNKEQTLAAQDILREHDREVERRAKLLLRSSPWGFCRIMVGGSRGSLVAAIARASEQGINDFFGRSATGKRFVTQIADLERAARSKGDAEPALCSFIESLSKKVVASGGLGVLLIVDELGKFLEYAAGDGRQRSDMFVLQRLAELAARSGEQPLVVVTMLHQAFERYAAGLPATVRDEWAKIQGRFEDVAFLDAPAQLLTLAARAITHSGSEKVLARYSSVPRRAVEIGIGDGKLQHVLAEAAPLHPTVALLLPAVFRSALAQNERSLFTFLTSKYDGGFAAFLDEAKITDAVSPWYRLDRLHDFLANTLGPALYASSIGKRWSEIEQVLGQVRTLEGSLPTRIIKCVGLLGMFGTRDLRASRAALVFALEDETTSAHDIEEALDALVSASLLVYRKHSDAFALWEGSDVDLDRCFQNARERIAADLDVVTLLEKRAAIRPWVARRHFIETGTLRYFEVKFSSTPTLASQCSAPLGVADGRILYLIPSGGEIHDELVKVAKVASTDESAIIIAIPKNINILTASLIDLMTWEEVRRTVSELAGDPVARRELAARTQDADLRLDRALQHAFGLADVNLAAASTWVHRGRPTPWRTARDVSQALSTICDEVYSSAPKIRNELLNRRTLSSAAAAARRSLLEAMIANAAQPRLGITGDPPELSMYASMLDAGGLHAKRDGAYRFVPPPPRDPLRLRPAWDKIEQSLRGSEGERKSVEMLQRELQVAPYGIKEGPFPVLLIAALLHLGDEVALFEQGTFVAETSGATIERLLKSPGTFEVARFRISGARERTLLRLGRLFPEIGDEPRPLELVRALCRRAAQLPPYARLTKRIAESPRAVRDALLQARDPLKLLFVELPVAVGMAPIPADGVGAGKAENEFADRVADALSVLADAYPSLLRDIERHLADALDLGGTSTALRTEFANRAKKIERLASDQKLRGVLLRAADDTLTWDTWLESIATLLGGRAPSHWSDVDLSRFESGLSEVATLFHRAEDLALEEIASVDKGAGIIELLRVSVATPDGAERRRLVRVHDGDGEQATKTEAALQALLGSLCGARPDLQLAVVGRLLHRLLEGGSQDRAAFSLKETRK